MSFAPDRKVSRWRGCRDVDRPAGRASFCTGNFNKDVTDEAASFFVPQKELKKMNKCKNTPDKEETIKERSTA